MPLNYIDLLLIYSFRREAKGMKLLRQYEQATM